MRRRTWIAAFAGLGLAGCSGNGPAGPSDGALPPAPEYAGEWGGRGTGDGELQNPHGIALNSRGQLFVADFENHRIQKFSPDGAFLDAWVLAAPGPGELGSPRDVACDGLGRVYVADLAYHQVRIYDANGGPLGSWGTRGINPGELFRPIALGISGSRLFVADGEERVQRFTLDGRYETGWRLYDGSAENYPNVFDLEVDGDGNVWVVENTQQRVRKFDPDGNLLLALDARGATPGAFQAPLSLAVGTHGEILVGEADDGRVQVFGTDGGFRTQWPAVLPCATNYGSTVVSMAVTTAGTILMSDASNARILLFAAPVAPVSPAWWTWGQFGTVPGTFYQPRGIAVDHAGRVYVADGQQRVQVFEPGGEFVLQFGRAGMGDGEFISAWDVAVGSERVYVTDPNRDVVQAFDRSGVFQGSWPVAPGTASAAAAPRGIAVDSQGNVYVCATRARIDVFTSEGSLLRSWGAEGFGAGQLTDAADLAVLADGTVVIADGFRIALQHYDATGGFLGEWALPSLPGSLQTVDVAPDGHLFVGTRGRIYELDATGAVLASFGNSGSCAYEFDVPGGVAADGTRIFVTDTAHHRAEAFVLHPDPGALPAAAQP